MAEKQETGLSKVVGGALDLAKPLATFDLQNDAVGQVANKAIDKVATGAVDTFKNTPTDGGIEGGGIKPEESTDLTHDEPKAEPEEAPKLEAPKEEAQKSSAPKQSVIEGSFTDVSKPTTSTDAQKAIEGSVKNAIEAPAPKPVAKGHDSVTAGGSIKQGGSARAQLTAPAPVRTPSPQKANASQAKVRNSMVNPGLGSYRIYH